MLGAIEHGAILGPLSAGCRDPLAAFVALVEFEAALPGLEHEWVRFCEKKSAGPTSPKAAARRQTSRFSVRSFCSKSRASKRRSRSVDAAFHAT